MCFAVINVSRTFQRYGQLFLCLLDRQLPWCCCDVVVGCDVRTSCRDNNIILGCDRSIIFTNIRALCGVCDIVGVTAYKTFILTGALCNARQFDFTAGIRLRC